MPCRNGNGHGHGHGQRMHSGRGRRALLLPRRSTRGEPPAAINRYTIAAPPAPPTCTALLASLWWNHHIRPTATRRRWPTAIEHPHQPPPAGSGRRHRHNHNHDATEARTPALCAAHMRPGNVGVPCAALHPLACPFPPPVHGFARHRRVRRPATHQCYPHHPYCTRARTPLVDPPPYTLLPSFQWHSAHAHIPWLPGRPLSARWPNG